MIELRLTALAGVVPTAVAAAAATAAIALVEAARLQAAWRLRC